MNGLSQAAQSAMQGISISPSIVTLIDFTIIAILVFAFVDGLRGGMFSFLLNIIALIVGYIVARMFYLPVKKALLGLGVLNMKGVNVPGNIPVDPSHIAGLVAFILVFAVAYALTRGIAYMIATGARSLRYSLANRLLGGVMNLIVVSAIIAIFIVLVNIYAHPLYVQIASKSISIKYLSVYNGFAKYVVAQASNWFRQFYMSL